MQQVAIVPEKAPCNDDDGEMSTASGASSDPVSLPTSPLKAWPNTPADTVSLPSSPLKASPDKPADEMVARATVAGAGPVSLADLPSLGSIGHFVGQCSRCCFHPKGRCENGYNCRFCHFDHEKRRRKHRTDRTIGGGDVAVRRP